MLVCRLLGHRLRFRAQGQVMRWECARGCGEGGSKVYPDAAAAARYARAFDQDPSASVGSRPTLSTTPIWLWRRLRKRTGRDPSDR